MKQIYIVQPPEMLYLKHQKCGVSTASPVSRWTSSCRCAMFTQKHDILRQCKCMRGGRLKCGQVEDNGENLPATTDRFCAGPAPHACVPACTAVPPTTQQLYCLSRLPLLPAPNLKRCLGILVWMTRSASPILANLFRFHCALSAILMPLLRIASSLMPPPGLGEARDRERPRDMDLSGWLGRLGFRG